jgi:hypothetical protein
MATTPDDADILAVRAIHPIAGELRYERVRQDRRTYYRLVTGRGVGGGSVTTPEFARLTIAYWREQGWLQEGSSNG